MAVVAASLADGQLASSKTTIYTSSSKSYIKLIVVDNVGASTEIVQVFVKRSGSTSRRIAQVELLTDESARIIDKDDALALSAGDEIEAQTTNATSVDYLITGGTE